MNAYDRRQYLRMKERLHLWESGRIPLSRACVDIDVLLGAVGEPDPKWVANMWALVGELDHAVALGIERAQGTRQCGAAQQLHAAVREMTRLLDAALSTGSTEQYDCGNHSC